ncbi:MULTISPECIES: glycosyltransferase family 2 protein [unclassified Bradyrhizobium]|uniref:glycosyltransferase family 2 protein n=1 Tax=unclassified Bradyrhizobium TaxID=2631580 RepID=UPI0023022801|nr:glycosyltransferase family 2 protein [Bradyrhizobium sp. CCBAU 45321]MDA9543057.1 glycosyl hydrolase [Bradyrhizobium sp. CCBAU 45321]
MRKKISLVTPCYNEETGIRECYAAVKEIFDRELPGYEREHIFCDNASSDRTVEILKEIAAADPSVKVIVNARNFGVLRNTYNGVLASTGDATVLFMPADLQDPPSLIPTFVKHWEQGYEIVFGIRARREEPFLSRTARHLYYKMISRMSYVDYPADVGDYQLVDRKVLDAMKQFEDVQPFMRMMPFECGFRSIGVPYTWLARKHGISRNRLSSLIDQGLLGAISFSTVPLRTAFFFGLIISSLSFAYAFVVFLLKIAGFDIGPHGIPTIIIGLFFFGGVQLFFLGVLGEYIVAIFNQVRRRPIVVERERINFD